MSAPLCPPGIAVGSPLGATFPAVCAVFHVQTVAEYRALAHDVRRAFEQAWTKAAVDECRRRLGGAPVSCAAQSTDRRHAILQVLDTPGGSGRSLHEIARLTGIAPHAVAQIIRWCVVDGLIRRHGSDRRATYRLAQPLTPEARSYGNRGASDSAASGVSADVEDVDDLVEVA